MADTRGADVKQFMIGAALDAVRSLPKNKAKLVGFCSAMVSFMHLSLAPAERGGRADLKQKILQEAERTKRSPSDVADDVRSLTYHCSLPCRMILTIGLQMYHTFTDEVVQIPGFPKMHHWEFDPQQTAVRCHTTTSALCLQL